MLEELLQYAVEKDADMVICDFFEEYPHFQKYNWNISVLLSVGSKIVTVVCRVLFREYQ